MISDSHLDEILSLQVAVAWAGEGSCEPPRLGWWRTDLTDPAGGGDLMKRLLPKTHQWASLEAVRLAALRADTKARLRMADPDKVRTLYFLGFELDERLSERLAYHKQSGVEPDQALSLPVDLQAKFSAEDFASAIRPKNDQTKHTVVPDGRRLVGQMPDPPVLAVQHLVAALVPFADTYPMPFYPVK